MRGESLDAIAKDGQTVVHHLKGDDTEVANGEGLMGKNLMKLDGRHTRIAVFGKAIGQHLEHSLAGKRVGIDVDFAKLAVGPYIVHSPHVVVVGMCDEDAVNLAERMRHDLRAEVGTAVDEQSRLFRLNECRTAQALVVRVGAATGIALAADGGHATRCSRS